MTIMGAVTWDSFERYRQKGLDARRAGQWDSARVYLLEAARAMVELSKEAKGGELRAARKETAAKLLDRARDCDEAKRGKRKAPSSDPRTQKEGAGGEQEGADAHDWMVKEKP